MVKKLLRLLILTPAFTFILVCFQNCGGKFESSTIEDVSQSSTGTSDPGTTDPGTTPPTPPPPAPPPAPVPNPVPNPGAGKVLVTVGVGVGGRLLSGLNGFETILYDHEVFSPAEQTLIHADPNDPTKLICPAGWTQIVDRCCKSSKDCILDGWHSDYLLRGVAFGNGRFVAVGGARFGIAYVSTDGVNWSPKYNLDAASGLVISAKTNQPITIGWLAGVAFGNGRFVAIDGYSGQLIWSVDGVNWTASASFPTQRNTYRRMYYIGNRFFASGDNSSWGFTNDGSTWTSTGFGSAPAPQDVYMVGNEAYGYVGSSIYRLPSQTSTQWSEVYKHSSTIGTFAYNSLSQLFYFVSSGKAFSSPNLSNWTSAASGKAPGRWMYFNGKEYVGNGTGYSSDGVNWKYTTSPTGASWVIQQYTSGYVN